MSAAHLVLAADLERENANLRFMLDEQVDLVAHLRRHLAVAELRLDRANDEIEGLLDQLQPATRVRHLAAVAA